MGFMKPKKPKMPEMPKITKAETAAETRSKAKERKFAIKDEKGKAQTILSEDKTQGDDEGGLATQYLKPKKKMGSYNE